MIARYLLSYAGDTERAQAEAAFFVANLGSPAMRAHTDAWYSRRGQVLTQHLDERAAAAVGTYAYGLCMQIARGEETPSEDDLTWVLTRLIDQQHTTTTR